MKYEGRFQQGITFPPHFPAHTSLVLDIFSKQVNIFYSYSSIKTDREIYSQKILTKQQSIFFHLEDFLTFIQASPIAFSVRLDLNRAAETCSVSLNRKPTIHPIGDFWSAADKGIADFRFPWKNTKSQRWEAGISSQFAACTSLPELYIATIHVEHPDKGVRH